MRHGGPYPLPPGLPVPEDDGAADGLAGRELPARSLASTGGEPVDLARAASGLLVLYVSPRTGVPGEPLPDGWDEIPGGRGCTPGNRAFRDHARGLAALGATVHGLSAQLGLPTFEAAGRRLYRRLTLIARAGRIVKVVYPVFPPGAHPAEVADWLREAGA